VPESCAQRIGPWATIAPPADSLRAYARGRTPAGHSRLMFRKTQAAAARRLDLKATGPEGAQSG
jgi:hypothetical protein